MSDVHYGDWLRTARNNARISQEELAYRAGVCKNTVQAIESGRRNPSLDTVELLCKALDATYKIG